MPKTEGPHCKIHPEVTLICPACRSAKGGAHSKGVSSKAKAKASARNGRLGGRPKLPEHSAMQHKIAGDPSFTKRLEHCAGCLARQPK